MKVRIVTADVAPVWRDPTGSARDDRVTEALTGEPVVPTGSVRDGRVEVVLPWQPSSLDERGYPGWVDAEHLEDVSVSSEPPPAVPEPGSTDLRLLRATMRARWLRCRRSEDTRYAVATGALPSHPPGDARDGAHRWIRAEPTFPAGPDDPVDLARTLLGTPYVWGGLSARGIDCSGLVHLMHRALGTVVPRDARDQAAAFPAVALEDVRRGDLYFFARPGRPVHHVGLVVEPGVMLHASDPDGGVVESPLASSGRTDDLWGAARVGGRLTMSR